MSITNPSYVQQCLDFKSKGVQVVALSMDAASMARIARSCNSVGYHPKWVAHPLGLGNERQFLGLGLLADTYVPTNVFPWMGDTTPAEQYWQRMKAKYIPGEAMGGAASSAWTAAALLVAATSALSADNPTSAEIFSMLYTFKGQPSTTLGGLTVPLTFRQGATPKIPYCLFGAISNDKNDGWKPAISKMNCTKILAPSDPQLQS
jgi:ABC-type branched-subunit amino acid transport system substrate-binding protein